MTLDPNVEDLKKHIAQKKARYADLRQEASKRGSHQDEFLEMLVLLQEINYLELSFRRDAGVCDFLKERERFIPEAMG